MASQNSDDDDSLPNIQVRAPHISNRQLYVVVCDLVVASVEHQRQIKDLAAAIRDAQDPVGPNVIQSLAAEIRRDTHKRTLLAAEIEQLGKVAGG